MDKSTLEPHVLAVGRDLRIKLPKSILNRVEWIVGKEPINGWLLMGGPGRCRLLSAAEVDGNSDFQGLRARIALELNAPSTELLEFRDEVSVALTVRLMPIRITPPDPGWRLTLPAAMAAIMKIRAGESELVALFIQNHIELWTIETLRSAVTPALAEIL